MKKSFWFFLCFVAVFGFQKNTFAKDDKDLSFVDRQFELLEKDITSTYSIEEVAELQSQVIDFKPVINHADDKLKLYIVSLWLKQVYHRQAFEVLETLKPSKNYETLFAYYKATLLIEQNSLNKAYQYIEKLNQAHPKDPDLIFLKSRFLAQAQNYTSAIEVLNTNLEEKKKRGKTYLQRGLLYILIFDYDRSIKDLKKAVSHLPKDEIHYRQMAYFQLGLVYLKHYNQVGKAQKYFSKGRKIDPQSPLARELDTKLQNQSY